MKKFFPLITVLFILISCNQKQAMPQNIEGKVIGATIYINTDSKQVVSSITVKDSGGKTYEANVAETEAQRMLKLVASDFQYVEPTYVRLKKGGNKYFSYEILETAVMSYDYGTPARFIFESDKKTAGIYKK